MKNEYTNQVDFREFVFCPVRPVHVQATEGQQLCVVCKDIGNGIHFGAVTCEGCKVRPAKSHFHIWHCGATRW